MNPISVLIVDDEKELLHTYAEYFSLYGIKTSMAYDGCNALTTYEEVKPDLVLMDLNMPKYDGNYAIEKIKEKYAHSKIFVITGNPDYKFNKNTVNRIFIKPLKLKNLKEIIINEFKTK